MGPKQWVVYEADQTRRRALAQALAISPITAAVLLARGVTTDEQARRWLAPLEAVQHDPFLLPDMERAVDRLHQAIRRGERVCVYGDYDVDGMCAASLYLTVFRALGADVVVYIPHRLREGYGLNGPALERLAREGVTLLVTADCGTTAHREVALATSFGLDVIVTDHHQADALLPPASAVLNPHRADSAYPFRGLCSAALAYKVAVAYARKYGDGGEAGAAMEETLDLVALATVADVVPLQDENRLFVQAGLAQISRGARPGLRALKAAAGLEGDRPCTASTVAFKLAPRLNAAGRLAHAETGVRLLTTESEREAHELAKHLEQLNRERQRIEEQTTAEALGGVPDDDAPAAMVLGARHWHPGVVGIVAARLVERFHRPAAVLAIGTDGLAKGSARSVPGFDLYDALRQCRDVLEGFGGHPCAAGLTVQEARLSEFRERFTAVAAAWAGPERRGPELLVDAEVALTDVDHRLVRELDRLHPFGAGNPEPTFAVRNLAVLDRRVVGERHLKLTVRHENSAPFESIGFRMGALIERGLEPGQVVDMAFVPELSRWNGLDRIQLRIRDLRASRAG
ncbi:single-stranded-DNA-specific exonuclease RecJ [Nitrospira sp. Kam-Ns4a]